MSSIFRKDDNYVNKPKRNVFDLSCQNNLTLKFGRLVPVLCQPVMPGDSFKIEPTFGLRYLPQVFPVQTRQRASIKYYYVRNRNLWKDWPDFIGKTKSGLTPPYLNFQNRADLAYYLSPSNLLDYMGVPLKVSAPAGTNTPFKLGFPVYQGNDYIYVPQGELLTNVKNDYLVNSTTMDLSRQFFQPNGTFNVLASDVYGGTTDKVIPRPNMFGATSTASGQMKGIKYNTQICVKMLRKPFVPRYPMNIGVAKSGGSSYLIVRTVSGVDVLLYVGTDGLGVLSSTITYKKLNDAKTEFVDTTDYIKSVVGFIGVSDSTTTSYNGQLMPTTWTVNCMIQEQDDVFWSDYTLEEVPFYNPTNTDGKRISALPFRAYEAVYNALIRNAENNPLKINGVVEYNKYNISLDGGAQPINQVGEMMLSNWSDDRFTTALPSPQQGNAPLVGLTGVQGATVVLGNDDGTQSTVNLKVDSSTGNVVMVEGVSSDSPEYLNDAMMSAVEYGITINDLRNVNAFQRWLENNIRRGYKYKDQLMSHYGVNVRYDVLDMPEFIGGVSRDVSVQQITQTVENEYGRLGEYGGNSYIMGEGHSIEHYCDEHGFIIGILEVKPMPLYSDTLPKYLVAADAFDYYFPEFGKIGMQPIKNQELSFSQSVLSGKDEQTFGYQRAWYDHLENLDEVHGLFRTDFRGYLLSRDFWNMPTLSSDFLTVDADDINNTFYSDDVNDKILGQVYHKITAKRPIPLIGIPSIEP